MNTALIAKAALTATLFAGVAQAEGISSHVRFGGNHNCVSTLDSPHPSGRVIKSHMRIKCSKQVLGAHVEN